MRSSSKASSVDVAEGGSSASARTGSVSTSAARAREIGAPLIVGTAVERDLSSPVALPGDAIDQRVDQGVHVAPWWGKRELHRSAPRTKQNGVRKRPSVLIKLVASGVQPRLQRP